jgi:hypothetical protein
MGNGSTGLLEDRQMAANVLYSVGDYSFALEWIRAVLDSTSNGKNRAQTTGNQVNVSAYYKF